MSDLENHILEFRRSFLLRVMVAGGGCKTLRKTHDAGGGGVL